VRHLEVIERFGRFPHRNNMLHRVNTESELAFLRNPMFRFDLPLHKDKSGRIVFGRSARHLFHVAKCALKLCKPFAPRLSRSLSLQIPTDDNHQIQVIPLPSSKNSNGRIISMVSGPVHFVLSVDDDFGSVSDESSHDLPTPDNDCFSMKSESGVPSIIPKRQRSQEKFSWDVSSSESFDPPVLSSPATSPIAAPIAAPIASSATSSATSAISSFPTSPPFPISSFPTSSVMLSSDISPPTPALASSSLSLFGAFEKQEQKHEQKQEQKQEQKHEQKHEQKQEQKKQKNKRNKRNKQKTKNTKAQALGLENFMIGDRAEYRGI